MDSLRPDEIVAGLGGAGLAVMFVAPEPGPRVLVRCELDALPITEAMALEYRSRNDGVSHKCGHDGHMAILAGVAQGFSRNRPRRGTAILLFQPAEETGQGAARVINDPKYQSLKPEYALALHNLPGYPEGRVILRDGVFAAASSGFIARLHGASSHAAEPEAGRSPAQAVAQLIQALSSLRQTSTALPESGQATVIHARVGEVAFGTSPGEGVVMATLRAYQQTVMDRLAAKAADLAAAVARMHGLRCEVETAETFPPTANDRGVVAVVEEAAHNLAMQVEYRATPFPWSEDFGHFTARHRGALFGLGAGETIPPLHHPEYDFPDSLIEPGVNLLEKVTRRLLEDAHV